jgi:DNA primase
MYDIANKYYQNNINTKQGAAARKYLENRKINNEIIKEFEIGLSLSEMDNLTKILLDKMKIYK